jgi:NADPH2:quinone reductase
VVASSLNYFDMLQMLGRYQLKANPPYVPGVEAAGVVIEIGKDVKHLKVGDEVFTFFSLGAFAEEMICPAARCLKKPANLTVFSRFLSSFRSRLPLETS